MTRRSREKTVVLVACALIAGATDAAAFRMIQNTSTGRSTFGIPVTCTDPGGFAHWIASPIRWRLNPANQGGKPGVTAAVQSALAAWTAVAPGVYSLDFGGTTAAGFSADGVNTISWGSDGACSGSCLAVTALVLVSGQVITEADILFNDAATWNTDGSDVDVQSIATHELGHSLGIHHTDLLKLKPRPTMYAYYFGTGARTLESDDQNALRCSCSRFPPVVGPALPLAGIVSPPTRTGVTLSSRMRPGGVILRYGLDADEPVRLDLYDIAGRKLTTLVDGLEGAGEHEVAWNGSGGPDRRGSGVFFARIVTPAGTARATVVLIE